VAIADPNQPIDALKGVGPSLKEKLARLGILRTMDLLVHLPLRYQDRSRVVSLQSLRAEQEALVSGQIVDVKFGYGRRRSLFVTIEDQTGFLGLRFFHIVCSTRHPRHRPRNSRPCTPPRRVWVRHDCAA
jgi:ATP-dependent DNA helicase RecG